MSVLWIVLPLAIIIVGAGVLAFVWAVRGGQMDDLDTPAARVALDDDDDTARTPPPSESPPDSAIR